MAASPAALTSKSPTPSVKLATIIAGLARRFAGLNVLKIIPKKFKIAFMIGIEAKIQAKVFTVPYKSFPGEGFLSSLERIILNIPIKKLIIAMNQPIKSINLYIVAIEAVPPKKVVANNSKLLAPSLKPKGPKKNSNKTTIITVIIPAASFTSCSINQVTIY